VETSTTENKSIRNSARYGATNNFFIALKTLSHGATVPAPFRIYARGLLADTMTPGADRGSIGHMAIAVASLPTQPVSLRVCKFRSFLFAAKPS
jgi:hypothetical protein